MEELRNSAAMPKKLACFQRNHRGLLCKLTHFLGSKNFMNFYVTHSIQWDRLSFIKPASSYTVCVVNMLCLLRHVSTFLRHHQELYCKYFEIIKC